MKELKHYEIIKTDDGSLTYYSKAYQESCHSHSGAVKETNLHYVKGCNIDLKIQQQQMVNVLEVGFGTGIGFLETAKLFKNSNIQLFFYSFEIDKELIEVFKENYSVPLNQQRNSYTYNNKNINLVIVLGNARETIKELTLKFHAIYQDAFSPKRNAILWTTEWFKDLKSIASDDCIMSTYSSSSSIRKSMLSAGWKLQPGEQFGKKRTSTRAFLHGESDHEIIERVNRSPVMEITDKNYQEYTLGN